MHQCRQDIHESSGRILLTSRASMRQNNRCSESTSNWLEGAQSMMKSGSGLAAKGIERVLELSAEMRKLTGAKLPKTLLRITT